MVKEHINMTINMVLHLEGKKTRKIQNRDSQIFWSQDPFTLLKRFEEPQRACAYMVDIYRYFPYSKLKLRYV